MKHLTHAAFAAALFTLLPFTGCLISSHNEQRTTGAYVPETTFSQIEPGKTTEDWVEATLGKPTSKSNLKDGSQLWKWTYVEKKTSSGAIFILLSASDNKQTDHTAFVQLKDGLVVKAWRA